MGSAPGWLRIAFRSFQGTSHVTLGRYACCRSSRPDRSLARRCICPTAHQIITAATGPETIPIPIPSHKAAGAQTIPDAALTGYRIDPALPPALHGR